MKRHAFLDRVSLAAIAAAATALLVAQAAAAGPSEPAAPSAIQVPDGNKVFLVGHAVGVQIYVCDTTPSGFHWVSVAPRANLYDDNGKLIATHFRGTHMAGLAPDAADCNADTAGTIEEVTYTADYYFWKEARG
jgi:hypothetical protein